MRGVVGVRSVKVLCRGFVLVDGEYMLVVERGPRTPKPETLNPKPSKTQSPR